MTTNILLDQGEYEFKPETPYEIHFKNAADILLPFQGTIVAPADTTTPSFGGMYRLMFLSLQYPTKIANGALTFPVLRDYDNKPISLTGQFLILAADDSTFLDNVNLSKLDDNISEVYDPIYKDNTILSSTARYLVIQFDNPSVTLPTDISPISRGKGFQLRANIDDDTDVVALRSGLGTASLSGKILAFDLAGHQTEAYSSLIALGVDKTAITGEPMGQLRIQFVDIHGTPLRLDDFPLQNLDHSPSLDGLGEYGDNRYFWTDFPDPTKTEFTLTEKDSSGEPDSEKYRYHFHHAAVWPGYNAGFKLIKETEGLKMDFFKDIPPGAPKPTFVRVALFHPADEFQTTAGGPLEVVNVDYFQGDPEKQARFTNNGFRLFTTKNDLKIFNTGEAYFSDYHNEISKLKAGDSLYQANWSGNAHLHLKGSMKTRLIEPSDAEQADVQQPLQFIRANAMLVPLDPRTPGPNEPNQDYLLIAAHEQSGAQIQNSFAIDVETLPGSGEPAPGKAHRGFVRPNHVFAWKLKGDPDLFDADNQSVPEEHTAHAYWKNAMGIVQETALSALVGQTPALPVHKPTLPFPADIIALDINNEDPPQAIIKRLKTAAQIRTALGNPTSDPYLLILNLSAGSSHKMPLIPAGSDDNSVDLVLGTLAENAAQRIPGMTGDDILAVAAIQNQPLENQNFQTTLLTSFKTFVYSDQAHQNAAVPRLTTESGGLLRKAISKGVTVRALMWEHLLKRLSGGPDLDKGHANNHQLVALINRVVNGKRGYAFIDQATRELGAWHQKPTVFMRKVAEELGDELSTEGVAYLGGMDMALGRWDTEYYFSRDPDRQTSGQNDVQMKITGDAAWDVLQNFRHRWKGIDAFLNDIDFVCNPVNTSLELEAEVAQPFIMPNPELERTKYPAKPSAFIQVNRTIPPFTCFSEYPIDGIIVDPQEGELGSLASYTKAISRARKFIMISEQYFFSQDIALAVRDALAKADGPEFVIIVLPAELDESKYVDPLFFKLRQKILNILRYGYAPNPLAQNSCEERIAHDSNVSPDLDFSSRIALLSLVNYEGKDIYTHSKHIIVDDVWMTAGSANMSNRGMTYEMEINAAVVGQKLYEGGTNVVRNQRIELCRRLLGLPKAYSAALEDPYAAFRLFKAIEIQQNDYSLNIYPLKPLVKWLDPSFVKRVPEDAAFDAAVDAVLNMDVNSSSFNYFICNLLDADGRRHDPDRLGYLAHMIGVGKLLSQARANLGLDFTNCHTTIRDLLQAGNNLSLKINATIFTPGENAGDPDVVNGPYLQHQYPLKYVAAEDRIELDGLGSNNPSVTISPDYKVIVTAVIKNETTDTTLACGGQLTFNPDPANPTVEFGQEYNEIMNIA